MESDMTTIPKTTRAAVLHELGQPLVVEEGIEIPDLRAGQVLVKMAYSGICHSQLMEARGHRGEDRFLPHFLGHEGTGRVIAVGDSVKKVRPGDDIVLGWLKGAGKDAGGVVYRRGSEVFNAGPVATFGEHIVVSENRCVPAPEGVPLDLAVLFGCAIPTGAGIVLHELSLSSSATLAIFGLGGIGASALLASNLFDLDLRIGVDVETTKLTLARELGATHAINASEEDPVSRILDLTNGVGVDFSVEAGGLSETIEQAFAVVRKGGGLCVFASHPKHGDKICLEPHDLISGKQIRGSWGGMCRPDEDIPKFGELYRQGRLPLERLVSARYSLEQINTAMDDLENRQVTRALIDFTTAS